MDTKKVGLRIKSLRVEQGFKQEGLAGSLGIGRSTLSKIESGEIIPTAKILIELKRIFSASIDWILTGEGARESGRAEVTNEEIKEMIDQMQQDKILKHAVLSFYFTYKADQNRRGGTNKDVMLKKKKS